MHFTLFYRPNLSFNLSQTFQSNFSDIKSIKVGGNAIKIQRNTGQFRNHAPICRNFIFFIYGQILMHFFFSEVYASIKITYDMKNFKILKCCLIFFYLKFFTYFIFDVTHEPLVRFH